jgi:hypothetical protein
VSPPGAQPVAVSYTLNRSETGTDSVLRDWPATECVRTSHPGGLTTRWAITNDCRQVVAVLFAWCESSITRCSNSLSRPRDWEYRDDGIVLAGVKPLPRHTFADGTSPLRPYAATIRAAEAAHKVRYLACNVTSADFLRFIGTPQEFASQSDYRQQLDQVWQTDSCLVQLTRWLEVGRRTHLAPDDLFADGV